MSEKLKTTIGRLAALRAQVEEIEGKAMSEDRFVSRFISSYSSTTWSRVQSGQYKGNMDAVAEKLGEDADRMEARLDTIRRSAETAGTFVMTRFAQSVIGAYQKALDDGDRCKIVVALAPTGAGKSTIADWLKRKRGALLVEGRQSWKTSYKAFCLDVAAAAGKSLRRIDIEERQAEDVMLSALGKDHGTLVVDEANTQCGAVANGLKLIVNQTDYTIVILAIGAHWDEFAAANTDEVKQVLNRCQAVIRYPEIPARDVDMFLGKAFAEGRKDACKRIAEAANRFGAYKTVKRVCDLVDAIEGATVADVEKAAGIVALSSDAR